MKIANETAAPGDPVRNKLERLPTTIADAIAEWTGRPRHQLALVCMRRAPEFSKFLSGATYRSHEWLPTSRTHALHFISIFLVFGSSNPAIWVRARLGRTAVIYIRGMSSYLAFLCRKGSRFEGGGGGDREPSTRTKTRAAADLEEGDNSMSAASLPLTQKVSHDRPHR